MFFELKGIFSRIRVPSCWDLCIDRRLHFPWLQNCVWSHWLPWNDCEYTQDAFLCWNQISAPYFKYHLCHSRASALAALGKAPNFYLKQKPFLFCFSGVKISVLLMHSYSNIRKRQERKLVTLSGNPSKSRVYDFAEVKQNLQLSRFGLRTVVERKLRQMRCSANTIKIKGGLY